MDGPCKPVIIEEKSHLYNRSFFKHTLDYKTLQQYTDSIFGNNQEIQYSGKEEQEMVVGCQRLIQNAIVLWNDLFLSQKLASIEDEEKKEALLKIIRNGSTLIWYYVNLHGEYDFTEDIDQLEMLFDMEKILALKVA